MPEIYRHHHPGFMAEWSKQQNESSKYLTS
jgi:hypothetical protein